MKRGLAIVHVNRPQDDRMGWIDTGTNQICINTAHNLYQKVETKRMARMYHFVKVFAGVLVQNAAKSGQITVEEAFGTENKILTECEMIIK